MSSKIKCRTVKQAPEGGWGYLVTIGLTIPFACYMGNIHSFGLMFNEFLANLGAETSAVTLVIGCYFSAQSFSGLFASALFRKFSIRSVGLFGAVLYFLGLFLCVFITSTEMLAFSFGILNGLGLGCIMTAGYSCFNLYFVKRRIFMMSLLQASKGVLVALYPLLVKTLMNLYGYRGAMAIIAAINAHAIVGMLVLHPIEWHYKLVEVTPEIELKSLLKKTNTENKTNEKVGSDSEGALQKVSIETPAESSISHQLIERNMQRRLDKKLIRSKSFGDPVDPKDFLSIQKRIESVMSLDDLSGDGIVIARTETPQIGIWQKLVNLFDLTLFKDWTYVNIVIGISFAQFSDNTLISLLPMYLETLGFSMDDAALVVSTGTIADFAARIGLALLSAFFALEPRYIYLAGAIGFLITRIVFLNTYSFMGMIVIAVFLGVFRTLIHVPVSLIYAGHLPPERFAAGYGLFMFFQGNLMFLLGPIVGWIRDKTQSYVLLIHCLQFFMCLCVVPWVIEIVWLRIKKRKNNR